VAAGSLQPLEYMMEQKSYLIAEVVICWEHCHREIENDGEFIPQNLNVFRKITS
jgi:hypothetical protein